MNAPRPPLKPDAIIALLRQFGLLKPKWIATFVVLVLVYALVGPWVVRTYGVSLPGIAAAKPAAVQKPIKEHSTPKPKGKPAPAQPPIDGEGPTVVVAPPPVVKEAPPSAVKKPTPVETSKPPTIAKNNPVKELPVNRPTSPIKPSPGTNPNTKPNPPPAIAVNKPPVAVPRPTTPKKPTTTPATAPPAGPQLGELKEVGRNVYESTAGLIYRPGSEDGHRVEHVMHHGRDDLDKPSHGVFDGDKAQIFALIDEAWQITQKNGPPRVKIEEQGGGRTTYTVFMNRKIGYKGGQSGQRQRNPALKCVKLVLEGNHVITAYPVEK